MWKQTGESDWLNAGSQRKEDDIFFMYGGRVNVQSMNWPSVTLGIFNINIYHGAK